MNKQRRTEIEALKIRLIVITDLVTALKDDIDEIRDEEDEYYMNMPEGLQNSERGELAQEAIGNLQDCMNRLEEFDVNELTEYLDLAAS